MMEAERFRQVLVDLSHSLIRLQEQIERVNQLLANATSSPVISPSSPEHKSKGGSPSALQPHMEQLKNRVEELEASERTLIIQHEGLLQRHRMCETEISSAVQAREGITRRYRHLVRVAIDLLQALVQVLPPDEEIDEGTRSAVAEDLRERLYSPSSSGSGTARPPTTGTRIRVRDPNREDDGTIQSVDAPSESDTNNIAETIRTPSTGSPVLQSLATGREVTLPVWAVHSGASCPASVKATAGPFVQADFLQLGFNSTELDGLFQSLILPRDVLCRLAVPPSPRTLENIKFIFLYDPFYLESGTRTYVLDWGTTRANREVVHWLQNSMRGGKPPVFHTFTFPTKKKHWYYFGGLSWNAVSFNDIWPTLNDQSRVSVLRQLSERSHNAVAPDDIARQLDDGRLQQLCIEIASTDGMETMQEVASRMGRSPRAVKAKRPIVRGEQ